MILVAVYLRVIKTQANTAKKNTTAVVTTMARVLRWKIRSRSLNVGSLSGIVFNLSPLPGIQCVLRGAVKAFSAKVIFCAPLLQHLSSSSQLFAFRDNGSKCCQTP